MPESGVTAKCPHIYRQALALERVLSALAVTQLRHAGRSSIELQTMNIPTLRAAIVLVTKLLTQRDPAPTCKLLKRASVHEFC
jgi:hypothetical protein